MTNPIRQALENTQQQLKEQRREADRLREQNERLQLEVAALKTRVEKTDETPAPAESAWEPGPITTGGIRRPARHVWLAVCGFAVSYVLNLVLLSVVVLPILFLKGLVEGWSSWSAVLMLVSAALIALFVTVVNCLPSAW